jgi:hypothetical protein
MSSASYVDYDAIASESFDPYAYANKLIRATNDSDEPELDFSSAQNKLKFDLQEVEREREREVELHWEALLERTEAAAGASEDVAAIEAKLNILETNYDKLEQKVVEPYDEAEPLYNALKNIMSTMTLLKKLAAYLEQVQALDVCKEAFSRASSLVELRSLHEATPALADLSIVSSQQAQISSKSAQTIRELSANIGQFKHLPASLSKLASLDRAEFFNLVKDIVKGKLDDASREAKTALQVSPALRRLQTTDNAKAVADFGLALEKLFAGLRISASQLTQLETALPLACKDTLLSDAFDHSASLVQYFWREFAHSLSILVREATRSNLWVLRSLRSLELDSIVTHGDLTRGTMEFSVVAGSLKR